MHFFLILQFCLAPFFNFFPLSDLNIIYSKFRKKSDFFEKISDISDFSPKNRRFFPIFYQFFFFRFFFCQNRFHATRKPIFRQKIGRKIRFFVPWFQERPFRLLKLCHGTNKLKAYCLFGTMIRNLGIINYNRNIKNNKTTTNPTRANKHKVI